MIYAVLGEELGFIGAALVLLLFFAFAWRGYRIAIQAPDRFSSLMAAGVTSLITLQAALNIAVVTASIPSTGIPLPFLSYGGTSLAIEGKAKAESVSVWARRRVPTGWGSVWERPVRYVFEAATTRFLGDEGETGLQWMSSLGFGLELDSSAKDIWVTRWRTVARYKFGPDMRGWSIGLAVSF